MMASNYTARARFVRCPKCHILLRELPEVPVYRCGGCETILTAKYHGANVVGETRSGSVEDSSDINGPENIAVSLEMDGGAERLVPTSVSGCINGNNTDMVNEDSSVDVNEEIERRKQEIPLDCGGSPSRYKIEQPSEATGIVAAAGSSHSYDASVSSPDGRRQNRLPDKYLLLSKRTFRKNKALDSVDGGSFDSNSDGCKLGIGTLEHATTFGSKDFQSVQNWIQSESDEDQNPKLPVCLEPDHMRILRKMDELRDELTGFVNRTVEGKRASQFHNREKFVGIPFSYAHKAERVDNEKRLAKPKSFCRPVSGGAPFVICYKCRKLLQLPADFLVTQKRLHKLQCGACSQVLVFSFRPRDRTKAPMTPLEVRHPPSEADNRDPISYSDDYGISYSSERDPALHVSRDSFSRDVLGSRLHRLMGYTSASELLFQVPPRGVHDEGSESTEPGTPHFCRPSEENMRYRWNGTRTGIPTSTEVEEDAPRERLKNRRKGLALQGLLKKGVRELSHGLESVKLKMHSNR